MAVRGVLVLVGVALALGAGVVWLRGQSGPGMKVPGPCEVHHERPDASPERRERPEEWVDHRYDAHGRGVLELSMVGASQNGSLRWEYDDAGNVVIAESNALGSRYRQGSSTRTRFTYDAEGRLLTSEAEGYDGVVSQTTRYRYDADGRKLGAHAEWGDGKSASDTVFEYDAEGRLVAERTEGDAQELIRYEHDAQGRVVREHRAWTVDRGVVERTIERQWDDEGRLVSETSIDAHDRVESTYTYDDHGNVLTRRERWLTDPDAKTLLETYDYRCWSVEDGRAVDERPPLE